MNWSIGQVDVGGQGTGFSNHFHYYNRQYKYYTMGIFVICLLAFVSMIIGIGILYFWARPPLQLQNLGIVQHDTNRNLKITTDRDPTYEDTTFCFDLVGGVQNMPGCRMGKNSKLTLISRKNGDFANYKIPCAEYFRSFQLKGNFTDDIFRLLVKQLRADVYQDLEKCDPEDLNTCDCDK